MINGLTQSEVTLATSAKRRLIADINCKGLYLDIRLTGKSYRFRYTMKCGKQRTYNIGSTLLVSLAQARKITKNLGSRLLLGEDIQAKSLPIIAAVTTIVFGDFLKQRYIPHAKLTKRIFAAELSILNKHILPTFKDRPLADITKAEITAFIHGKIPTKLAPGTINRLLNCLKAIFTRAIEWDIGGLDKNPAHGVKQLPNNHRHERFLTPEEALRLLGAVNASPNKMLASIIAFLLLTGCRKREVLDARWENINLTLGQLTIPLSKSGAPRYVTLSAGALHELKQVREILHNELGAEAAGCPWAFPNPATGRPFISIYESWNTARCAVGLRDVRVHDLRHSFASALVNRGATLFDVQKLLGHSSPKMTERYSHLTPGRLMEAAAHAELHYTIPDNHHLVRAG